MALTDTAIRGMKPGKKPFKMYDRDGLFLLVNPGESKLWRWRYRVDGKEKLMALGEYPVVGLERSHECLRPGEIHCSLGMSNAREGERNQSWPHHTRCAEKRGLKGKLGLPWNRQIGRPNGRLFQSEQMADSWHNAPPLT